jgi:hypothetical protein
VGKQGAELRTTPFAFAILAGFDSTVRQCAQYGGSLLGACPEGARGYNDPPDMDVALWVATVLKDNSSSGSKGGGSRSGSRQAFSYEADWLNKNIAVLACS